MAERNDALFGTVSGATEPREGAVARLRAHTDALHQEIEWLANCLLPVLSPEVSDDTLGMVANSELETIIAQVEAASVRLSLLRARVVL